MSYYRVDFIGSYFMEDGLAKYICMNADFCVVLCAPNSITLPSRARFAYVRQYSCLKSMQYCRIFAYLLHEYEVTIEDGKHWNTYYILLGFSEAPTLRFAYAAAPTAKYSGAIIKLNLCTSGLFLWSTSLLRLASVYVIYYLST